MMRSAARDVFSPRSRAGVRVASVAARIRKRSEVARIASSACSSDRRPRTGSSTIPRATSQRVEIDAEVDLLDAPAQLVERASHVALGLAVSPLAHLDVRLLQTPSFRVGATGPTRRAIDDSAIGLLSPIFAQ
jgi:hypothetical protein